MNLDAGHEARVYLSAVQGGAWLCQSASPLPVPPPLPTVQPRILEPRCPASQRSLNWALLCLPCVEYLLSEKFST